jgi:hypothetical protein
MCYDISVQRTQEFDMSEISRDDVITQLGTLDDITIAEIIATGATLEQLQLARAEIIKDEKRTNREIRLPLGPVGRVIDIVERVTNAARYPITGSLLGEGGSGLA